MRIQWPSPAPLTERLATRLRHQGLLRSPNSMKIMHSHSHSTLSICIHHTRTTHLIKVARRRVAHFALHIYVRAVASMGWNWFASSTDCRAGLPARERCYSAVKMLHVAPTSDVVACRWTKPKVMRKKQRNSIEFQTWNVGQKGASLAWIGWVFCWSRFTGNRLKVIPMINVNNHTECKWP